MVHDKKENEWREDLGNRIATIRDERSSLLNEREGESLSMDDLESVYMQAMGELRNRMNMSLATKTKTGEINDYLEVRRPFGAA